MVERYHARVYSLSYGVLRNAEDAEESTQDAFLTLHRKIDTFDEDKKFFSWFYRVALNTAYSRARRRQHVTTVAIEDYLPRFDSDGHFASVDLPDGSLAVDDDAALRELASRAEGFIAELPALSRRDLDERRRGDERRRDRGGPRHFDSCVQVTASPRPALRSTAPFGDLEPARAAARGGRPMIGKDETGAACGDPGAEKHDEVTCRKLILEFLLDYESGAMPEADRVQLQRHFEDCPPCGQFLTSYRATGKDAAHVEAFRGALRSGPRGRSVRAVPFREGMIPPTGAVEASSPDGGDCARRARSLLPRLQSARGAGPLAATCPRRTPRYGPRGGFRRGRRLADSPRRREAHVRDARPRYPRPGRRRRASRSAAAPRSPRIRGRSGASGKPVPKPLR